MAKNFTSNTSNITSEFICVNCGFICDKKGDFNRHILTAKHKRLNPTNEITSYTSNFTSHECPCGKKYKHQSSLLKHKKTCTFIDNDNKSVISSVSEETIMNLIQENKDIKQMLYAQNETTNKLIDIIPKVNNNTTNNNNTINNNQKFNINIFLNEKCKDAIDIKEFISQIQLTLENLDFSRTQGLEAGLTNVIIENMNKLSLYERPIHCTDTKRETLYIKDDDKWEKDKDKTKIKEVIKKASNKNYTALKKWKDENPDFMDDEAKQIYYAKAMSAAGKPIDGVDEKIIKNVCKQTYVKEDIKV